MDNNRGGPQATAEEHEIELMKQQLVPSMSEDIEKALRRLNESAGGIGYTIFKLPEAIGGGIAEACRPRICYSESTDNFSGPDLVRMMVLDGCFIIEFLCQGRGVVPELDGSLFDNIYVGHCVMQDLLRLENQVPYFVLEDLFGTTIVPEVTLSLADLIFDFFSCFLNGRGNVRERRLNLKGVHLLDAFRLSFIPWHQQDDAVHDSSSFSMIRSASELQASTFLDIKFDRKRRIVGIPKITVEDDDLNWILPNMIAFEQCCGQWNACHVSAYAMFMGCLIHTVDDVQLLRDCKVISNHGLSNEGFAHFFDNIGKAAPIPFKAFEES
ncbi:hypothetical protein EUGRSUZ_E02261 [Eucalyptus grandis]|uniref:Uncharacterized protein n=2 Tax=Eucalyptus grandis TaxID=71139 RepID=A0ACC3KWX6_EUCGR|nr:hypothetical protein EUGRSUZ_E02261 [Eucalyptus grandis]